MQLVEMVGGSASIDDDERLLHRWDPEVESHYNIDEATGLKVVSSGAFTFDGDPVGCSNYCASVLSANGLVPRDVLKRPSQLVVSALVGDIRALTDSSGASLFDAEYDPWPLDPDRSFRPDIAHSLVVAPAAGTRSALRRLKSRLATVFRHGDSTAPLS